MKEHPMLKDLRRIVEEYDSDEVAAGLRRYLDAAYKTKILNRQREESTQP